MDPAVVATVSVVLAVVAVVIAGPEYWADSLGVRRYADGRFLFVVTVVAAAFVIGTFLPGRRRLVERPSLDVEALALWTRRLLRVTVAAYVFWVCLAIIRGLSASELFRLLSGERGYNAVFRDQYFASVPGVTTLSTLVLAVTICSARLLTMGYRSARRWLILCIALAAVYAVVRTERLALIEVLLAAGLVLLVGRISDPTKRRLARKTKRRMWLAVPAIFVIFVGMESIKSWGFYQSQTNESLVEFSSQRLFDYYATALNNAAIFASEVPDRPIVPYYSLEAIWKLPMIEEGRLYELTTGSEAPTLPLAEYGRAEFTNPSGVGIVAVEFGIGGAVVVMFAVGVLSGRLYRGFLAGRGHGVLVYPCIFVGCLELPRVPYLALPRAVIPIAVLWALERNIGRLSVSRSSIDRVT